MIPFLQLENERRKLFIEQASNALGLPEQVVEKDFWVTLALKATFSTETGKHLVFKGGTSLSKGWGLIDRFSEDIDLALNRELLGFSGKLSNSQREKLRKASCRHLTHTFKQELEEVLADWSVKDVTLTADDCIPSDKDPVNVQLQYPSLFDAHPYMVSRVLLEVGCRSLIEPKEHRTIGNIMGKVLPAEAKVIVPCVLPKRTFLEKCILMHEEFHRPQEKANHERRSRHLYDITRIMDSQHGADALGDKALLNDIISHRKGFTKVSGIDYDTLSHHTLDFVPPGDREDQYRKDYDALRRAFFQVDDPPSFGDLMEKLRKLRTQFRDA
jgi:Nucleotidyl transferase AbiEii toxin, Type IV TA system